MYVLIRKSNKPLSKNSASVQNFTPHMNHAISKQPMWIGTRGEYDKALKSRGLVLHDPDKPEPKPKRKDYVVTKETRKLVEELKHRTNKDGSLTLSSNLQSELVRRKVIRKKSEVNKMLGRVPKDGAGGFSAAH